MTGWRRWAPFLGLLVLAGLVVVGTSGRSAAGPRALPHGSSLPVETTSYVCPDLGGSDTAPTTLDVATVRPAAARAGTSVAVTTTPLNGAGSKPTTLPHHPLERVRSTTLVHASVVTATGPGAGGVVADQQRLNPGGGSRGLFSTPCLAPGVDFWITGVDGRVGYADTLVLANPGTTLANVTVTAWTSTGRVVPPKLQAYTVPAGSAVRLPVSDYTPDAALVTLHVHANSGRIAAEALDHRISGIHAAGIDWIPPTLAPSRHIVVPGFPGGAGPRQLLVTDPGSADATVSLRLATGSGNFAPAGHPTVLVRAGHTAEVDLTTSLGSSPGAVVLDSDAPVTAAAVSESTAQGLLPDVQWLVGSAGLDGPAVLPDNTPPFGTTVRIYVTAPDKAARLRVTAVGSGRSKTYAVPAGRTLAIDPVADFGAAAYDSLLLTPVGRAVPLFASRSLYAPGAHGPLATSEQPVVLPASTRMPPVVEDPRAALP